MALVRAADAMLRSLGGEEVCLLFPLATAPDDPAVQLGLADPGVEEVKISPAVLRNLGAETKKSRVLLEFLMPASVVLSKVEARQAGSARTFFDSALGIAHEGRLLRIERVDTEFFAGTAYLYRITAGE
jgi:hypothetical protein